MGTIVQGRTRCIGRHLRRYTGTAQFFQDRDELRSLFISPWREIIRIDHKPDVFNPLSEGVARLFVLDKIIQGKTAEGGLLLSVAAGDGSELLCINMLRWQNLFTIVNRPFFKTAAIAGAFAVLDVSAPN
jgi:hypothetical protein